MKIDFGELGDYLCIASLEAIEIMGVFGAEAIVDAAV